MKMIVYSVFLFLFSVMLISVGICVMLGRYDMMYDYYISHTNDLKGYTRAHGIAMICMSLPLIACGVLFLLKPAMLLSLIGLGILVLGIVGGYVAFYQIQKKYNGGMF